MTFQSFEFTLQHDLHLFGLQATKFPENAKSTHEQLHSMVPFNSTRTYAGLSKFTADGEIEYHAVAGELLSNELSELGLNSYLVKAGNYHCIDIENFMNRINEIGDAFAELIKHPQWDKEDWAVELYFNDTCRCMVRLKD